MDNDPQKWCHIICAKFQPSLRFDKGTVRGIELIDSEAYKEKCIICNQISGIALKCS